MKLYDFGIFIIIGIVSVAALVGIMSARKLGPDNIVEEVAEEVIDDAVQYETGVNPHIDLTPSSPEDTVKK